jgi:phosphoadenosine phosphosulfate reductase
MSNNEVDKYQQLLESKSTEEIILWAVEHYGVSNVIQATSLSAEDQVITDMLMKLTPEIDIFTLDTGRLPQETYNVLEETRNRYNKNIDIVFPETGAVEVMVNNNGPNLFYESIEKRKLCCRIRKVEPLKRKLSGKKAWICGLRREQASTRTELKVIEWDINLGINKINPIAGWSDKQVFDYIKQNNVPYNRLHDNGYPSIGCVCCTRAIKSEEEIRAGRWWWENPEHKECGLHIKG